MRAGAKMYEIFPATAKAAPGSSSQPLISICIPTYNFGAFISETLESLEQQDLSGAEIVVLDSASTDNTQEVVASFACRLPNLRYIRTDKKLGIDRDMARVAAEAHGQFIWLFSADDVMRPDALALVKPYLKEEYDVLLCSHTNCDKEMNFLSNHPVIRAEPGEVFDLSDNAKRRDYFARAATTEAFVSFMSGVIFKSDTWRTVPLNEKFLGSCWAHVARFFEIMKMQGVMICFIGGPLLNKRGENDSFLKDSVVDRWRLGIDGFQSISREFFGLTSDEHKNVTRVLRAEFRIQSFLALRLELFREKKVQEIAKLDKLFTELYGSAASEVWLQVAIYRFLTIVPISFLPLLKRAAHVTGIKVVIRKFLEFTARAR